MKRHIWRMTVYQPGYKEQKCRRCGAERHDSNMYVRQVGGWSPARLNGKRQPFCSKGALSV